MSLLKERLALLLPPWLKQSEVYSVIATDMEGRYVFVNQAFKERFGFITAHFEGEMFIASVHPDDVQPCLDAAMECLGRPHLPVKVTLRKPEPNGTDFYWTQWEFSAIQDGQGQPLGILCVGHDVTETKHARQQAQDIAEKIEVIIENIADGFYVLDKEWRFVKMNRTAARLLGQRRRYLIGRSLWDAFPFEEGHWYPRLFKQAVAEQRPVHFEDCRPSINQWFDVAAYPSPEGLTVFFRDITERRQAQQKLADSENKLRAILDSTTDSNLLIDRQLRILSVNRMAQEKYLRAMGRAPQVGENMTDYVVPADLAGFLVNFARALGGERVQLEKDVYGIWHEFTYFPVYDEQCNLIGVSFNAVDIDARKRAALRVMEQNAMFREIARIHSHDLRRPVSSILGLVQLTEMARTLEECKELIGYLRQAGTELDQIIRYIVAKSNELEGQ